MKALKKDLKNIIFFTAQQTNKCIRKISKDVDLRMLINSTAYKLKHCNQYVKQY